MSTQFTNRQWRLPNEENKSKVSNYSMDFDSSSSDYIQTSLSTSSFTSFTISAWVYADSLGSYNAVASQFRAGSTTSSSWFLETIGSNMAFGIANGSSLQYASKSFTTLDWHHVVGVWNGTQIEVYVDGVASGSPKSVSAMNTNTVDMAIGGIWNSAGTTVDNGLWNGKIDGVSIFDYALSSSQITTLYGSSSTGIGNPMTLNPVAYYPLGDQDAFNGSSYLTPNASLQDYVFDFDGGSGGIYINDNTLINGYTAATFSFWFKGKSGLASFDGLLCQRSSDYTLIHAHSVSGNNYKILIQQSAGGGYARQDSSTLELDKWYHVCVKGTVGSIWNIYINGQLSNSYGSAQNISGIVQNTDPFKIGRDASNSSFGEFSNVQIFNTELPATGSNSVETLYNNGSPLTSMSGFTSLQGWWKLDASATYDSSTTTWTIPDDSTNSNDGTSSGMTQANLVQSDLSFTSGYSPYALDFDSAGSDAINCGNDSSLTLTSNFSVSAWMKSSSQGSYAVAVSKNNGNNGFSIQMRKNNNRFAFNINDGSWKQAYYDGINPIDDGKWHHVVGTFDGSIIKIYVDNIKGTDVSSGTMISNTANFTIAGQTSGLFFNGQISNVSYWNTALTSAQVSEIYNEGVPSNLNNHSAYSNLVSWWQLGSNSSFNSSLNQWTCIDEKGTNTGESSQTFNEDAIVDGVGSYANGLSSGMGGDEVIGDAPYSTANALSVNMDVLDRVTDTPS